MVNLKTDTNTYYNITLFSSVNLYATSVDYNPHSEESVRFFKIVQNKLHYAAHGHTAAEVIYQRADAEKPFMGLTSFAGELPVNAIEHKPMYMDDYVKQIVNTGGKKGIVESIPFLMPEKF